MKTRLTKKQVTIKHADYLNYPGAVFVVVPGGGGRGASLQPAEILYSISEAAKPPAETLCLEDRSHTTTYRNFMIRLNRSCKPHIHIQKFMIRLNKSCKTTYRCLMFSRHKLKTSLLKPYVQKPKSKTPPKPHVQKTKATKSPLEIL